MPLTMYLNWWEAIEENEYLKEKEKWIEGFINVDIEFTVNNGNRCGEEVLCGIVFWGNKGSDKR